MLPLHASRRLCSHVVRRRSKFVNASPVLNPQLRLTNFTTYKPFTRPASVFKESKPPKTKSGLRVLGLLIAAIVIPPTVTFGGLYGLYRYSLEEVPITKRKRLLWRDENYEETVTWFSTWISTPQKPIIKHEEPEVVMVQKILDRFLQLKLVQGQVIKLFLCDTYENPNAAAMSASNGGRIFFDVGEILKCQNPDEVASILAHELAHIIAKHSIESNTAHYCAKVVNLLCGYRGFDEEDLITKRMQEYEADHIGLFLLAEAGINPQARIDYLERHLAEEDELFESSVVRRDEPECLSTHPPTHKRLERLKSLLPDAKEIYEKQEKVEIKLKEWDSVVLDLQKRQTEAKDSPNLATMTSEQQLRFLVYATYRLIDVVEGLKDQMNRSSLVPSPLSDQADVVGTPQQADSDESPAGDTNQIPPAPAVEDECASTFQGQGEVLAPTQEATATEPATDDGNKDQVTESVTTSAKMRSETSDK